MPTMGNDRSFSRELSLPVRINSESKKRSNTLALKIPTQAIKSSKSIKSSKDSSGGSGYGSRDGDGDGNRDDGDVVLSFDELKITKHYAAMPHTSVPPARSQWDAFTTGTGEIKPQTITNSLDNRFNGDKEELQATQSNGSSHRRWRSESTSKQVMPRDDDLEPWKFKGAYPNGPVCIEEPNLFLFSEPTIEQCTQFDVIINVAKELSDYTSEFSRDDKHEYFKIPWSHNSHLLEDLPSLTRLIDDRLNAGKRVLVHCQCGVSRSASLVMAYLMFKDDTSYNEAYEKVKNKVNRVSPNLNLIYELIEWRAILQHS